ncbi:MAG: hypothetical protein GY696_35625 [Gammaproteobacteria bacterium]|nr:hypothetical protein [Gammaproteobacteria bacterium]
MEWLLTVNGTTSGDLRRNDHDDFGMVHGDNGRIYQPISRSPYPTETGDRRLETGDPRWDGVDRSMVAHIIHSMVTSFIQSIHQSLSTSVTREEDERGIHDGRSLRLC